ncbi:hypothetical protein Tco_0492213 [Tanacetum coccineum]
MKSILTQSTLDALCEKFHIPDTVHPELPGPNDRIPNSPTDKIRLSVIATAKVSHFEIMCRVHGFVPTIDSLKHWNEHFFWVDASVFPLAVLWHNNKTLRKDPHPTPVEFNADVCNYLADNPAPFRKLSEPFLCFFGISRYHDLDENCYSTFWAGDDEEMDLFAYINHADPTKVRIGEREVREEEVSLLQLTKGRVVPLTGVTDQENANIQGAGENNTNEEGDDAAVADQIQEGDHVIQDEGVDFVRIEDEVPVVKLTEDHGTSGHVGASTGGKSLVTIQELFEQSTLNVEVVVTAVAIVPFFTSFVTPIPECGDGRPTDSVSVANLRTQRPSERFVISSYSSHDSSANDEVTSIVRSSMLPPPLMIATIATTVIADVAGPSQPASAETSTDTFFVSQDLDSETLQQIYVPKWDMINDSALDDPEVCRSMVDQLAPPRLTGLLKDRDAEVASLKAQLTLKEAEALVAISLRGQIATVEAAKAARVGELDGLKKRNSYLKGQVAVLESATAIKDAELASSNAQIVKVTQELSNFQLSCDELSIKAASFESEKDNLISLVSTLEGTCSGLRDEVSGYKLFKEKIKVVQDEQVKMPSDKVAGINADRMGMALHLDEEFYPQYLAALRGSIGCAIDKGIKDGLAADIDHGKAGRGLAEVAAYNLAAGANYVAAVSALRDMDFPLLAQLASHKDASMSNLMDLLRLKVVIGETSLSFSLDVIHVRVQRIRIDATAHRLSLFDALVPLIEPLSTKNLIGEASTSGPSAEVPSPSKIVFENEELETTLEHTTAS